MKALVALLFAFAGFQTAVQAQEIVPGTYSGRDSAQRACSLVIIGSHEFVSRFILETPYGVYWADASEMTNGHLSGSPALMRDGLAHGGKPYYRAFYGAPIGAQVIKLDYDIAFSNGRPLSISYRQRPFHMTIYRTGAPSTSSDTCSSLRRTGD